jgi:hypothetical protein
MPEHDESYFQCNACTIQKMENDLSDVLSGMPVLHPMESDERCLKRKMFAAAPFRNPVGSDREIRRKRPRGPCVGRKADPAGCILIQISS